MIKVSRNDIEALSHHLLLKIEEAREVSFQFRGRNRHSYNRMFFVIKSGSDDNWIYNHNTSRRMIMRESRICFMPCDVDFEFSFNTDMEFVAIHFNLELFKSLDLFSPQNSCESLDNASELIREVSDIINSGHALGDLCRLKGIVMNLAGGFSHSDVREIKKLQLLTEKYGPVFEFIKNEADAATTIGDIAKVAAMSKDSLSREFPRDCGVTVKQYLNREMVCRSEKLLLETGATAREVAAKLNFNNEYYFSRFFKKNTGVTPGEYKRIWV